MSDPNKPEKAVPPNSLRARLGAVRRTWATSGNPAPVTTADAASTTAHLLVDCDPDFDSMYSLGLELSGTPNPANLRRRHRFYNLVELLKMTAGTPGLVAECGTWRGLSAFLLATTLRDERADYAGESLHLFDSFAGLSDPSPVDLVDPTTAKVVGNFVPQPGHFTATPEIVRSTLRDFPKVSLHAGWIPDCFHDAPPGPYRLVHVDVDLHQPTVDSIDYFFPLLSPGGVLVCDDYGSIRWPGAKQAVDDFVNGSSIRFCRLSTGQAVLFKD